MRSGPQLRLLLLHSILATLFICSLCQNQKEKEKIDIYIYDGDDDDFVKENAVTSFMSQSRKEELHQLSSILMLMSAYTFINICRNLSAVVRILIYCIIVHSSYNIR